MGATLSANIPYEIGAENTASYCLNTSTLSSQKETCTNVFQEWSGSYVRFSAWYQSRTADWCGSWIPYVSSNVHPFFHSVTKTILIAALFSMGKHPCLGSSDIHLGHFVK